MTALYAAAMFINGCGYLLFPLLARTRMAAADKKRFVPATAALFVISAALAEIFTQQGRESSSRSPRWLWAASSRRVALGRGCRAAPDRHDGKALRCGDSRLRRRAVPDTELLRRAALPPRCGRRSRGPLRQSHAAVARRARAPPPAGKTRNAAADFIFAAAMVVLLSYFYSLGDGVLMKLNAEGKLTVFKWPRPLLHPIPDDRGMGRRPAQRARPRRHLPRCRRPDRVLPRSTRRRLRGLSNIPPLLLVLRGILRHLLQRPVHAHAEESGFPELWACLGRIINSS